MSLRQVLTVHEASARIGAETGIPVAPRSVRRWLDKNPPLKALVGGRVAVHAAAVEMIAAGVPLREIAVRLDALNRPPDNERGTGRE